MVSRDRGQLILVGAIAIALILLGLVLIVNTALFTQVVGSEGTVESAKEGGVSGQETGDALAAVVAEANRENTGSVPSISDTDVERRLVEQSVEGSGAYVSVSYLSDGKPGTIIRQDSPGAMTNQSGDTGWNAVTGGDVGEFVITIDTAGSSGGSFDVTASDATDARILNISVNSAGTEVDLSGAGQSGCTDVRATDGTVRIDVQHGTVYEDGRCSFDLFDSLEGPYDVRFDGGSGIQATYWLVTDRNLPTSFGSPGYHAAIWSFTYEFTYDTPDATVRSDPREVDVYD